MESLGGWLCALACKEPFLRSPQPHRSCGHEPHLSSKLDAGGEVVSQVPVLKVWVTDVGYKHFAPQGEALLSSLPVVGHSTGGGVYGKIVLQPLLPVSVWFA